MQLIVSKYEHIGYIGADIVTEIIQENKRKYTSNRVQFAESDITTDKYSGP